MKARLILATLLVFMASVSEGARHRPHKHRHHKGHHKRHHRVVRVDASAATQQPAARPAPRWRLPSLSPLANFTIGVAAVSLAAPMAYSQMTHQVQLARTSNVSVPTGVHVNYCSPCGPCLEYECNWYINMAYGRLSDCNSAINRIEEGKRKADAHKDNLCRQIIVNRNSLLASDALLEEKDEARNRSARNYRERCGGTLTSLPTNTTTDDDDETPAESEDQPEEELVDYGTGADAHGEQINTREGDLAPEDCGCRQCDAWDCAYFTDPIDRRTGACRSDKAGRERELNEKNNANQQICNCLTDDKGAIARSHASNPQKEVMNASNNKTIDDNCERVNSAWHLSPRFVWAPVVAAVALTSNWLKALSF